LLSGAVTAPAGAAPAHADRADAPTSAQERLLGGLPLPDRASIRDSPEPPAQPDTSVRPTTPTQPVAHQARPQADSVVVLAGDSLWSIAAAALPPGADDDQVDGRWREIYAANRAAIGADPDIIRPGLRLTLPPV
nr:LysM peptidoglycan-binding domain-containing protein [Nocardioides sp.]